ncbi:hypothetical protein ACJMK2_003732 [Sinanodonta woodiana]|uniref:Sulfotransferase domain-containing protein n=1 Tax=Sinanodonta woodiana TaxID=1069815 RepID=A0ABD3XZ28_SINWO
MKLSTQKWGFAFIVTCTGLFIAIQSAILSDEARTLYKRTLDLKKNLIYYLRTFNSSRRTFNLSKPTANLSDSTDEGDNSSITGTQRGVFINKDRNLHEYNIPDWEKDITCSDASRKTVAEDLLCWKRPTFLPNYKNPCWNSSEGLRCLPYFHIIGVCKTGTTDLFQRMTQHPQILANKGVLNKETWFWAWKRYKHELFHKSRLKRAMTLEDFLDNFDSKAIKMYTVNTDEYEDFHPMVTGHGDPMDFWDQASWKMIPQNDPMMDEPVYTTPHLIKHVNPGVKLILLLRDPIERLYSNYLHGLFGRTSRQFAMHVLASISKLGQCSKTRSVRACLYTEEVIKTLKTPISASLYSIHLKEWLKVFPRKQIFIMRTEDYSKDIVGSLLKIFQFLELDALPTTKIDQISNITHFYEGKLKKSAGNILPETRKILEGLFGPFNRQLAGMLNDTRYLWLNNNKN